MKGGEGSGVGWKLGCPFSDPLPKATHFYWFEWKKCFHGGGFGFEKCSGRGSGATPNNFLAPEKTRAVAGSGN